MRGACELCGAADEELRILFVGDFAGLACEACRWELQDCQERRYCATGEETEPSE